MRFSDLVGVDTRPDDAVAARRTAVDTDTYLNRMSDEPRNNGFVTGLVDRRRANRMQATRRGFLRGTLAAAAATTAVATANLFGPARKVEAQSGIVGTYPRRIMTFCPPYNSGDNCQPGCGSSPICTDCCGSDGFFRNDPGAGYTLYAGGCGDGDIADGWLWRFNGKCGNCAQIEYRCSDGYVQTDTGPAPFICRAVTDCVPLAEGEAAGPALADAARSTNWRPAGALEVAIDQGNSVAINGWIADGSGVPVQMRIRANNAIVHWGTAALPRPDIASTRRGAGPNTGFAVSFPTEPGDYQFCVDALQGVLTATVGCVNLRVGSGGSVRGSGQTGALASPPATSSPSSPDSTESSTDAAAPEPTPTPGQLVLPEAREDRSESPTFGAVQVVRRSAANTGFVSGWAADPDTAEPCYIEILVDGEQVSLTQTELPRPDVRAAFQDLNTVSGFAVSFPLPSEPAEVCVVAISPDDLRRQPLGCQQLQAASSTPIESSSERPTGTGPTADGLSVVYGEIETVEITDTGATVSGWCFDPNERDRVIDVTASTASSTANGQTGIPNLAAQQIYGVDAACGYRLDIALRPGLNDLVVAATSSDGSAVEIGKQLVVMP